MKITEIRVSFGRTFVPPGGDKFQPARIDCGVTAGIEDGDDLDEVRAGLQVEVRRLVEETFVAQCKRSNNP